MQISSCVRNISFLTYATFVSTDVYACMTFVFVMPRAFLPRAFCLHALVLSSFSIQFVFRSLPATPSTMAVIYGDSNVVKYLPMLKEKKSDPAIQATTVTRATNVVLLRDQLSSPKDVHSLVIVSALTNLVTSKYFDDFDKMVEHCQGTFNDIFLWIQEGREALSGFAETVIIISDPLIIIVP